MFVQLTVFKKVAISQSLFSTLVYLHVKDQFWTRFSEYQQQGLCTRSWKATMGLIRLNMIAATIAYPLYRLLNRAEGKVLSF